MQRALGSGDTDEQGSNKSFFFPYPLSPPLKQQTWGTSGPHMDPVLPPPRACWADALSRADALRRANFKPRLSKNNPPFTHFLPVPSK